MRTLLALLLAGHGVIHGLGFANALGLVDVPLSDSGYVSGALWFLAGLLLLGGAAMAAVRRVLWWTPALAGIVLSQMLILDAWDDARFGTAVNVLLLVPVVIALADHRRSSLRTRFRTELRHEFGRHRPASRMIGDEDLAPLPEPVARWLRRTGVVGRPRVRNFRAVFGARIRGAPDEPWMEGGVEQYEFFDPATRLFFMKAGRLGVPVDVFHRYAGVAATMQARILGLFTVVDESGPDLTRSETVTLLNDMFLLAPAALVTARIEWQVISPDRVRATFTNAGHTVSAVALFDGNDDLVDFVSEDRYRIAAGKARLLRWSTPVRRHGEFDGLRLFAEGEARWTEPSGEQWAYARFELERIEYDVSA